jgi:hypothetical protein
MNGYQQVLFEEEQRLPGWVFWLSVVGMVIPIILIGCGLFLTAKDKFPIAGIVVIFLVILFEPVLLWIFKLHTQVREDGLYVRLFPVMPWFKKIRFDEIKEFHAREYKPISEYGGWGIKWGKGGKAYNMQGNKGVQLVLENGKKILIGSQRADELAEAIESAKQNLK